MIDYWEKQAKRYEERADYWRRIVARYGLLKKREANQADEQKPVAWMHTNAAGHTFFRKKPQDAVFKPEPLYTAPCVSTNNATANHVDEMAKRRLDRAVELLERCENEMRYAGWTKFESDNPQRNGLYEQIKGFLK